VAIGYIVSTWLIVQVADIVLENIGAPGWVMQTIMLLLALGFPVVVFFSWAFEVTPEGIKRESEIDRSQSITHVTGRKLDRAVVAVLVIALAYFAFDKFVLDPKRDAALVEDLQQAATESTEILPEAAAEISKSIAVLPFVNISSDEGNEYFSDGITEELLNVLTRVPELRVISRSSAFSFKGQNIDISAVAAKLNVSHVLEGSVRKAGNRVRITAQLIETSTDTRLWSETYDHELDDVFAIQDEISQEVVKALQIQLLGNAPAVASTDTRAYTAYLQGMHYHQLNTPESWKTAEQAFRQAISIDPEFAPAWAALSFTMRSQANLSYIDLHEGTEAAREAAMRALELDDTLADAWAALADIQFTYDWNWDQAEGTIRTALQYGPSNSTALGSAALIFRGLGRLEEAVDFALRALETDPLDRSSLRVLAITYWMAGRTSDSEATLRHSLDLYPEAKAEKAFLAAMISQLNRPEEAIIHIDFTSDNFWHQAVAVSVLRALDRLPESDQILESMIVEFNPGGAYQFAEEFAMRGNIDEAFRWLSVGYDQRDGGFTQIIADPLLVPLHDDPRWEEILDRVGLLKYWREARAGKPGTALKKKGSEPFSS
jgi:adenylate cyclase